MSKPLQPGMLCVITGCRRNPANVGRVVTLVQLLSTYELFKCLDTGKVLISGSDSLSWLVTAENLVRVVHDVDTLKLSTVIGSQTAVSPKHLTPLEGGEDIQEAEQQNQPLDTGVPV